MKQEIYSYSKISSIKLWRVKIKVEFENKEKDSIKNEITIEQKINFVIEHA